MPAQILRPLAGLIVQYARTKDIDLANEDFTATLGALLKARRLDLS
jgi:hypothetical protein